MRLRLLLAAFAAFFVVAAPATAADPIPGALYEGTTEDGNPFSFRVAPDGSAVTDVLATISVTCVGPEGGVVISALASKLPIPVSGGTIAGKDEEAWPWLEMAGTFTSPSEAEGTMHAAFTKFTIGEGVTSCMRDFKWTAKTAAPAPDNGGGDVGSGPTPAPVIAPPEQTGPTLKPAVTKRAKAIKRCKKIKSAKRRSKCLRRARRIRN
ncbi:MAG TPA: hypothetical protein VF587_07160 [Solirubrobacteraceae bacterium]|jgi:hypothetical protein